MSVLVKSLVDSLEAVDAIKIAPNNTADQAYVRAIANQTNYLLVMDEKSFLGIVTLKDIIQAKTDFGLDLKKITVSMVNIIDCEAIGVEDDMLIYEEDLVLKFPYGIYVKDNQGLIIGLITKAKLTSYLLKKSKTELAIKDIENILKTAIKGAYEDDINLRKVIIDSGAIYSARLYQHEEIKIIAKIFEGKNIKITKAEIEENLNASFSTNRELNNFNLRLLIKIIETYWLDFINVFQPVRKGDWVKLLSDVSDINDALQNNNDGVTLVELNKVLSCANWLRKVLPEAIAAYKEEINLEVNTESLEEQIAAGFKSFLGYLKTQSSNPQGVTLEVSHIQGVITIRLPEEALSDENWWKSENVYSKQWLSIGWRVIWASFIGKDKTLAFEPIN